MLLAENVASLALRAGPMSLEGDFFRRVAFERSLLQPNKTILLGSTLTLPLRCSDSLRPFRFSSRVHRRETPNVLETFGQNLTSFAPGIGHKP